MTADKVKMKVGFGEWIVVCDGRKAIILENVGDEVFPNLKTKEVLEHPDLSTRALGTDAVTRRLSAMGNRDSLRHQHHPGRMGLPNG